MQALQANWHAPNVAYPSRRPAPGPGSRVCRAEEDQPGEFWQRASRCEFDRSALAARDVSAVLADACLRALAAKPEDRYASADELAVALEGAFQHPWRLWKLLLFVSLLFVSLI